MSYQVSDRVERVVLRTIAPILAVLIWEIAVRSVHFGHCVASSPDETVHTFAIRIFSLGTNDTLVGARTDAAAAHARRGAAGVSIASAAGLGVLLGFISDRIICAVSAHGSRRRESTDIR